MLKLLMVEEELLVRRLARERHGLALWFCFLGVGKGKGGKGYKEGGFAVNSARLFVHSFERWVGLRKFGGGNSDNGIGSAEPEYQVSTPLHSKRRRCPPIILGRVYMQLQAESKSLPFTHTYIPFSLP